MRDYRSILFSSDTDSLKEGVPAFCLFQEGELTPTPVFGVTLKTAWRGQLLLSPFSVSLSLAPYLSFSFPSSVNLLPSISIRGLQFSQGGFPEGLPERASQGFERRLREATVRKILSPVSNKRKN